MTTIQVTSDTDAGALVGQTFSTEHFGRFTIRSADQAPELRAIAYGAQDERDGYLFLAFLPWGKELIG